MKLRGGPEWPRGLPGRRTGGGAVEGRASWDPHCRASWEDTGLGKRLRPAVFCTTLPPAPISLGSVLGHPATSPPSRPVRTGWGAGGARLGWASP